MSEAFKTEEKTVVVGGLVDTFYHTLDPKRRLTIPSEWRVAMGNPDYLYVFPDADDKCLDLIPMHEIQPLLDDLRKADIFDSETDEMAQAIMQYAQMLKIDASGRIRVGDNLLEYAGIASKVTLVGGGRKAKLWAGEKMPRKPKLDLTAFRAAIAKRKAARQSATGGAS
ncbi:MAG: division/cell wall cluster transcriptional repressor MraZ [Kiritimatiellia bacterium]